MERAVVSACLLLLAAKGVRAGECEGETLYWVENRSKQGSAILKRCLETDARTEVVHQDPGQSWHGLALDVARRRGFVTSWQRGAIGWWNLDEGSPLRWLTWTEGRPRLPLDVALDPAGRRLYWTEGLNTVKHETWRVRALDLPRFLGEPARGRTLHEESGLRRGTLGAPRGVEILAGAQRLVWAGTSISGPTPFVLSSKTYGGRVTVGWSENYPTGARDVAVHRGPDGTRVFWSEYDTNHRVRHAEVGRGGRIKGDVAELHVGELPFGLALSADGQRIFVGIGSDSSTLLVGLDVSTGKRTLHLGKEHHAAVTALGVLPAP